jgi:hypothetical protein
MLRSPRLGRLRVLHLIFTPGRLLHAGAELPTQVNPTTSFYLGIPITTQHRQIPAQAV